MAGTSLPNASRCLVTSPIMVTGPRASARSTTWESQWTLWKGTQVATTQTPGTKTYNITALEALTPGKAIDFTNPDAVERFPDERRKWLKAQTDGKKYKFSSVARAQYAVIEVQEKNEHLLADTMTTDKAIELLQSRVDKADPFFLAVGLVRPHFPFVATEKTIGQYDPGKLTIPNVPQDDHDDLPPQAVNSVLKFEDTPLRKMRQGYYGAVSFMDRQVGRLLDELDRLNLRDKTIVVFVSDHGYLLGEHHMWKKAKLWEEAIRVPLIISTPGGTQDVTCRHFVELVDLYPTLTELANLPDEPDAQGQSLVPLLQDPQDSLPRTDAMIQVSNGFGLRSGKWAWMWYPRTKKNQPEAFMLYDMQQDPEQYTNLAADPKYTSVRKRLHKRLLARIESARE